MALLYACRLMGQATAILPEREILMGNIMRLEILVSLPNDTANVEFPLLRQAESQHKKYVSFLNDTIELLTAHKRALETEGETPRMRYDLSVQVFDSGRYEIPSLEFIVDGRKVASNPVEFSVLPVKVKADDKIDDFTGVAQPFELNPNPEEMEEESSAMIWWWIACAIMIALAVAVYIIFKRKGRVFHFARALEPYEVALGKLEKLKNQNLPQRGKTKEYYTKLTEILRIYLKKQFGIKTYEKTSAEILRQIEDSEDISLYVGLLKSIFETADFVKFAKVNPSDVENSRCLSEAEKFVKTSHPQVENEIKKGGGE